MTNLFEAPTTNQETVDPNKNYIEELVGEGKKFRDMEALARAKAESDAFIARLQKENEGIRQELNTRLTVEQLMDKMAAPKSEATPPIQSQNQQTPTPEVKSPSPEDIERLVNEKLSQAEKSRVQNANLSYVRENLEKAWGNDYVQRLKEKATELGVGEEFLQGLAKDQPKAFLKLIDATTPAPQVPSNNTLFVPPSSQQSAPKSSSFSPTSNRTKAYYDSIKAKNPAEYWSPAVQNQMHEDAIRIGEAFFDS